MGSAGQLVPGIEARVVKPDGQLAKPGEPGELVVRGPSMALGYLNNPKAYVPPFSMKNLFVLTFKQHGGDICEWVSCV